MIAMRTRRCRITIDKREAADGAGAEISQGAGVSRTSRNCAIEIWPGCMMPLKRRQRLRRASMLAIERVGAEERNADYRSVNVTVTTRMNGTGCPFSVSGWYRHCFTALMAA